MSFKSDYGSEVDLNKFLKKILLSKNGEKFLLHQVNDDVGLVEAPNNDALTWLALIIISFGFKVCLTPIRPAPIISSPF